MTGFEVARAKNLPPTLIIECAACTTTFALADGCPFPVYVDGEDAPHLVFFCGDACFLRVIPPECCVRA